MIKGIMTAAALGGCALLAGAAVSEKPVVVGYTVKSRKLSHPVTLIQISDLHGSVYGKGEEELLRLTEPLSPDAIMLTGDIADDRVSNRSTFALAEALGRRYRCFYVIGNHEVYTGRAEQLKARFRACGFTVLSGEGAVLTAGKERIVVCGIDDPYASPDRMGRMWEEQLSCCDGFTGDRVFSVLLTHRPEPVSAYTGTGFDLILAGHAHGGQVILPGLLNGLYAPHQGWFPKYAGGRYRFGNQTMIVSRGLSKYVKPRVFNRPELVVIRLIPEGGQA